MAEASDPLELLQNDMAEDDPALVLAAVQRLRAVALALGPERSRADLVPFLQHYCFPVDSQPHLTPESYADIRDLAAREEALTSIAAQLNDAFTPLLGGAHEGKLLFPLLESLCKIEETVVRKAASSSLASLVVISDPAVIASEVAPIVQRLASDEWFSSKVSSSALFASVYKHLPPAEAQLRQELRASFSDLCGDDMPMVRQFAFQNLADLTAVMEEGVLEEFAGALLGRLKEDGHEGTRKSLATVASSLAESLQTNADRISELVLPLVNQASQDNSWRVRRALAERIGDLSRFTATAGLSSHLLGAFSQLCQDREAGVRKAAVVHLAQLARDSASPDERAAMAEYDPTANLDDLGVASEDGFSWSVPESSREHLVPLVEQLRNERSKDVQAAFAGALLDFAAVCGSACTQQTILPVVADFLQDETYPVRLQVVEKAELLVHVIGKAVFISSVMPQLVSLFSDTKWRIRLLITQHIAPLARHLGQELFDAHLRNILLSALTDAVFKIRRTACSQIADLAAHWGTPWAVEHAIPPALQLYDSATNYLHRMVSLQLVADCSPVLDAAVVSEQFVPLAARAALDPISNVRLYCVKVIKKLQRCVPGAPELGSALETLARDTDEDVAYQVTLAAEPEPAELSESRAAASAGSS